MKKILLLLMFSIVLFGVVSGAIENLGTFEQGTNVTLIQTCSDCTYNNISSVEYPNGTVAIFNQTMARDGTRYTFIFTNTSTLGTYAVHGYGDPSGTIDDWNYFFDVSYRGGDSLSSGQGVLYLSLIIIFLFFFVLMIFAINKLPDSNTQDEYGRILSISYLKYLRQVGWMFEYALVIGILFLSSNLAFVYLQEQLFAQILFALYYISLALAPIVVIVMIIWIFRQMFHDKQMQNLLNRGIFPQGRL